MCNLLIRTWWAFGFDECTVYQY